MSTELTPLLSLLKQTFEQGAWHGPSAKEALEDLTPEEASRRIGNAHTILELVGHMAAWRSYVVRKVSGDAGYKVSAAMNFPSSASWAEVRQRLDETQDELTAALQSLPTAKLQQEVPGIDVPITYLTLFHSILHHDVYHCGQIVMLKKLIRNQPV